MTIETARNLICDHCKTGFWEKHAVDLSSSKMRDLAKQCGWKRIRVKGKHVDLCDECVEVERWVK